MTYRQVCRLCFLGIDDELKNDASSVYSTNINSSFILFRLLLLLEQLLELFQLMKINKTGLKLLDLLKELTLNE